MKHLQGTQYNNQRVFTTAQLATAYEVSEKRIMQSFNTKRTRFIEGKHYYFLEGPALAAFKNHIENFDVVRKQVKKLYLWTEEGALLHAKPLNTDRAWEVFDHMEEVCSRKREQAPQTLSEVLYLAAEKQAKLEAEFARERS